jgi:nitroreductase
MMATLDLSTDELLTTTRAVRKRLDLTRPVEEAVIRECLELAIQAPTPGGSQGWHFVVVTDPARRAALAALYRRASAETAHDAEEDRQRAIAAGPEQAATFERMMDSSRYLQSHLHEVPVLVIPCITGRAENLPTLQQIGLWAGIMPATWSFMLAARARGLGTALTTIHLLHEREAAEILGIPYEQATQVALIPVAYTLGTTFKPAARKPLDTVLHWDRW